MCVMSGTPLWLIEPIPNDDIAVVGLSQPYEYESCMLHLIMKQLF